ncbi:hypothetical protein ABPG77_006547 [Micractinium sp. CCAP 211/92]
MWTVRCPLTLRKDTPARNKHAGDAAPLLGDTRATSSTQPWQTVAAAGICSKPKRQARSWWRKLWSATAAGGRKLWSAAAAGGRKLAAVTGLAAVGRWARETAAPAVDRLCRPACAWLWGYIKPPAAWSAWYQTKARRLCRPARNFLVNYAAPGLMLSFACTGLTCWPLASAAFICQLVGAGLDLIDLWLGPEMEWHQAVLQLTMVGLSIAAGTLQLVNVSHESWWQLAAISSAFGIATAAVQLAADGAAGEAAKPGGVAKMLFNFAVAGVAASTLEWVAISAGDVAEGVVPVAAIWLVGVANALRPAAAACTDFGPELLARPGNSPPPAHAA